MRRFDTPIIDIASIIEREIKTFKPQIILTHSINDIHIDHQISYKATLQATRPGTDNKVEKLLSFEILSSSEKNFEKVFSPNYYFEVSKKNLKAKIDALKCYKTEVSKHPFSRSSLSVKSLAAFRGAQSGNYFAEAFKIVRSIQKINNNMYILGLHNDEDAGVCLLKDGKILDVVNEERLIRKKLYKGFPLRSLDYTLKKNNLKLSDINYFAYGWHSKKKYFYDYTEKLINRIIEFDLKDKKIKDLILERLHVEFKRDGETFDKFLKISKKIGIPEKKIIFLDHHKSHAWSAYACSPFKKSLVFTMDARGDLKSSSVSINDKKLGLREIDNHLSFDSLGFVWTNYLLLRIHPHKHEGKVTGLAAYGNYRKTLKIFRKLINWNGKRIVSNLGYYRPFFTNLNKSLKKDLKKFSKEDIAAGLQYHCEDIVSKYVSFWMKKLKY